MASSSAGSTASSRRATSDEHAWTFVSNYAHVLVCVARDPNVTLRRIAEQVGVTERAVHRIVTELETVGVVTRVREGRRNHYDLDVTVPLRHPLEADNTVGDLLAGLLTPSEAKALGLRSGGRSKKKKKT
ncbi:MAG: winged helix-turn-helix domain-containing protein [Deltaproteobacteria bacterium]|nr:winged helix-turn-helix domain-containing protein [Deltaproteobacteria bacterium]